ncbi:hypothetical protein [Bradyrhizobium elkanii]|uniref:hypothetical protein n=1 Tax=Bradyrhizobium elkanii TaxID=29448 RepID=UPI0004BAFC4A|nr:hypothetical protein [Bradyrhizobium elkanii]
MIVVIQCAARKRLDAGSLETRDGRRVLFVADPSAAPTQDGLVYARPDDAGEGGRSWRDELVAYNKSPDRNPLKLLPAFELYQNEAYRRLADKVGTQNLYILSAGWGLVSATFLTPSYDITFTAQAEPYKKRRKGDHFNDLSMLTQDEREPILFFGGKDYLPVFARLTGNVRSKRIVFFNSALAPQIDGGRAIRFRTTTRTNWHYECADAFLSGALDHAIG